jgi:hypothetical protein
MFEPILAVGLRDMMHELPTIEGMAFVEIQSIQEIVTRPQNCCNTKHSLWVLGWILSRQITRLYVMDQQASTL